MIHGFFGRNALSRVVSQHLAKKVQAINFQIHELLKRLSLPIGERGLVFLQLTHSWPVLFSWGINYRAKSYPDGDAVAAFWPLRRNQGKTFEKTGGEWEC